MADIQLRFNHDILVLSTPMRAQLTRMNENAQLDGDMTLLVEPEVYDELYALECAAGAQCLVTDTSSITPARLAHTRLERAGAQLAETAVNIIREKKPQHIIAEIGPSGLPLDASSKASLNEVRDQFSRAVNFFSEVEDSLDAYFLNGFDNCTELKCALMGLRKVTDKPVFSSVTLSDTEKSHNTSANISSSELPKAVQIMAEYGSQVIGFQTAASPEVACSYVRQVRDTISMLPILVQLDVREVNPEQESATPENPYFEPDTMVNAADVLKDAGVQFLRAVGNAAPSYTGALVAATTGDSVNRPELTDGVYPSQNNVATSDPAALAETLRNRVNAVIRNN